MSKIKNCFDASGVDFDSDLYDGNEALSALEAILLAVEDLEILGADIDLSNKEAIDKLLTDNANFFQVQKLKSLEDPSKESFLYLNEVEPSGEVPVSTNSTGLLKSIFFGDSGKKTMLVSDVLKNIANNTDKINPVIKNLFVRLASVLNKSDALVRIVPASKMVGDKTMMQYNASTNVIEISEEVFDKYDLSDNVSAFIHEVIHTLTIHVYKSPATQQERNFKKLIDDMYAKYIQLALKEGTESTYGFTNEYEFIAELVSNPAFQNHIKNLEKNSQNFWQRFISALRNLLGLKNKNEADAIIEAILQVSRTEDQDSVFTKDVVNLFEKQADPKKESENVSTQRTIEQKLKYRLNSIKDNLQHSLRAYDSIIKKQKDTKNAEHQRALLNKLLENIEELEQTDKWKAISTFITQLSQNLEHLVLKVNTEDILGKDGRHNIEIYERALAANALVDDLSKLLSDSRIYAIRNDLPITVEELDAMQIALNQAKGNYEQVKNQLTSYNKAYFIERFNNRTFASKVVEDFRRELVKEYNESGADPKKRDTWVNQQMNVDRKDELDEKVLDYIVGLAEEVGYDISKATLMLNSTINTNSKLVQLFQNVLNQVRERIIQRSREVDFKIKDVFDRYNKKHGKTSPKQMYKNLYEYSATGSLYLKGEYSIKFRDAFYAEMRKYEEQKKKYEEENDGDSEGFYDQSDFKKWVEENTSADETGATIPHSKWKNDLSNLTPEEKEALNLFRKITRDTEKQTFRINSLIKTTAYGGVFYKVPSVTKSQLERSLEGESIGALKDTWKNFTKVRVDDIGFDERYTAPDGTTIENIKVNFRGKIKPSEQSHDLFTVYRLEAKNGINYQEKHNEEQTLTTILEVAKNKDYFQTTGFGKNLLGKYLKYNPELTMRGENSNTYKRLKGLMSGQIYDIMHVYAGSLGSTDVNKLIGTMNGWTASVGMTLNEVTAAANVLNGKAQFFLETVAGNYITRNSLAKAEKVYFSHMKSIFEDLSNPVKTSFVNQLTDLYDTYGLVSVSAKQAFIKNNLAKATLNFGSLQFMQESGEHWLQSTLTMAILEEIKVMNADGEFIDKKGNVVEKDKAASLLDMHVMNKNGKLEVSPLVKYTTRSMGVEYDKGGKEMINSLVKKKIFDTLGNYDSNMQPEAMRHWYGKLFLMYRKYLVPLGVTRYRGFAHIFTDKEDLADHQTFYNEALQEYEEGYYTGLARFFIGTILPAAKELNFKILSADWQNLSDYEKANIRKGAVEFVIMFAILPALTMLIAGSLEDDDEEDKKFRWFLLLQTRRLQSELSAYVNPIEQYRILNNPIPSLRIVQNATSLVYRLINPRLIGEKYVQGKRKGQFKIQKNFERLLPILNSTNISYKEKYEFIENITKMY